MQNSPFQTTRVRTVTGGCSRDSPTVTTGLGTEWICAALVPTSAWISLTAPSAHLPFIFVLSTSNTRSKSIVNNQSFSRKGYFYCRDSCCCLPQPCIKFPPHQLAFTSQIPARVQHHIKIFGLQGSKPAQTPQWVQESYSGVAEVPSPGTLPPVPIPGMDDLSHLPANPTLSHSSSLSC